MNEDVFGQADGTSNLPGLSVVELEVGSRCNRRCSYCPVSLDPRPPVPVRMTDDVFRAVVRHLAEISFAGRISYHFYNEPLLRRDLAELVRIVSTEVPEALQILNTNGDLLDDRRYEELWAAGIDYFFVTRHSDDDFPERPHQVVQHGKDLLLTNRGGTLVHLPGPEETTTHLPCFAPSDMLIVTVTGDVLLCYEDASRDHVMGNVLERSLADIWNSTAFSTVRERLRAGDRTVVGMCGACSNAAHMEPGRSALEDPVLAATGMERTDSAVRRLKQRAGESRRASSIR